jgi:Protein of unknown function (DUF4013)
MEGISMTEESLFHQLRMVYRFPFQSPRWQSRYLIGVGFSILGFIVPVIPWIFLAGYLMRVLRNSIDGKDLELPDWADWGDLALDGLRYLVVTTIFLLPSILVFVFGMGFYFFTVFSGITSSAIQESSGMLPAFFVLGGMFTLFVTMLLGMLLGLLGTIPLPMALAHCAAQRRLGAAFQFKAWWPLLWANKLDYFIAWANCAGLFMILYLTLLLVYYTIVLICLTPILAALIGLYVSLVLVTLFGRYYRENLERATVPEPLEIP